MCWLLTQPKRWVSCIPFPLSPLPQIQPLSLIPAVQQLSSQPSLLLPSPRNHTDLPFLTSLPSLISLSQPSTSSNFSCKLTGHACQKTKYRLPAYLFSLCSCRLNFVVSSTSFVAEHTWVPSFFPE